MKGKDTVDVPNGVFHNPVELKGELCITDFAGIEAFVTGINGSWSNVVGLPLAQTLALLGGLGYRWPP